MPPYGALSGSPRSRPIATPVSAAWPSAALKNAIRRVTTRWLSPPRIGARIEHAEKAADEERILEVGRQPALLRQPADPGVEGGHRLLRPDGKQREHPVERQRLRRRPFGDDRAIEHRHAIGDAADLLEVVRHHEHRSSLRSFSVREQLLELAGRRLRRGRWPARRGSAARGSGSSACASSTRRSSPPDSTESGRRSRPRRPTSCSSTAMRVPRARR